MSNERMADRANSHHPFDYTEHPLPVGTVVDASAGTGKTYAVASHVTLALAKDEKLSIGRILVTTFTRNAAAELRDRVRQRIIATAALLRGAAREPADDLDRFLLEGKAGDLATVASRLERAAAEFDTATIATIHAVCTKVLACAGRQVQHENREDVRDRIIAEVVNDELIRESVAGRSWPEDRIVKLVDKAASDPSMEHWIEPVGEPPTTEQSDRVAQLEAVRSVVTCCVKRVHAAMKAQPSYDDLLRLAWEVVEGGDGEAVVAQLRERFQLAIVDEAQDTDPLQWKLFRRLFPGDDGRRLITVGDPKQAIYGFRGADVNAYVTFTASSERRTLPVNRRSDKPIIDTLNRVMEAAVFLSDPDDPATPLVPYEPVDPADSDGTSRIQGPNPVEFLSLGEANDQNMLAEPVARRVVELLDPAKTRLHEGASTRPVRPSDICVIVRTKSVGNQVAKLLAGAHIRSVTAGVTSVMKGEMAGAVRDLLEAMARPSQPGRIRRVAATRFFGNHSLRDAGSLSDEAIRPVQDAIADLTALVHKRGIAACGAAIAADADMMRSLTAGTGGQRHLADFTHIVELLHEHGPEGGCLPDALLAAFARLEKLDDENDTVVRRVETDDDAVKIMTVHAAKGLEFPCVIVADLWKAERSQYEKTHPGVFHDATGRRVLDLAFALGGESPTAAVALDRLVREERKRLLYVAVTRAQHFLCVLTAKPKEKAPPKSRSKKPPADEQPPAELKEPFVLPEVLRYDGIVMPRSVDELPALPEWWEDSGKEAAVSPSDVEPLPSGDIRQTYERTSFSGITARRKKRSAVEFAETSGGTDEESDGAPLAAEPAEGDTTEIEVQEAAALRPEAPGDFTIPDLPAGKTFGTVVHEIFERLDLAKSLEPEVAAVVKATATSKMFADRHDVLTQMIVRAMQTPFGGPLGEACFADFPPTDRLAEMNFEMGLADMTAGVQASDVGRVLKETLPASDPLQRCGYLDDLGGPSFNIPLAGLINGSIDAVLRLRGDARPRLVIADYKTNKLHRSDASRPAEAYAPDMLVTAMADHHYPLQAAIYGTAVYRMLRWRLCEADPADCIAGIVYAFIRGAQGGAAPADGAGRRHGMFVWQPPTRVWSRLSGLFAGDRS